MASDALRALALRYREQPAGTPGTRDAPPTGSLTDTSESVNFQGVASNGTPRTPGTRENSDVHQDVTDAWGLTVADRAAAMTRLRGTALPRRSGPESDLPEPVPPQPLPEPRREDAAQATMVAGLLVAARRRPPSWADPTALPSRGCCCTCCKGQRWWRESEAPRGWRCSICHPPDHFPPDAVTEVRT